MEPPAPQCFVGLRFLVSRRFEVAHESLLLRSGAAVVSSVLKKLTNSDGEVAFDFAVVDDMETYAEVGANSAAGKRRVRALRVPVFTTFWVRRCVDIGALINVSECRDDPRLLRYNPQCFAGTVFTTSGMTAHVKRNVRDAVTFFGGAYSGDLLSTTDVVIVPEPSCKSLKVRVARERNLSVMPLVWLQKVVEQGMMTHQDTVIADLTVDLALSWAVEARSLAQAGSGAVAEAVDLEAMETAGCLLDGGRIDESHPPKRHRSEAIQT